MAYKDSDFDENKHALNKTAPLGRNSSTFLGNQRRFSVNSLGFGGAIGLMTLMCKELVNALLKVMGFLWVHSGFLPQGMLTGWIGLE
jgi:hypothetical protein